VHGNPVISDGAFRSRELSGFRADRASVNDVFREYPSAFRVAEITVREIIDAGCIVVTDEPPQGHLNIYRGDKPGDRISGGAGWPDGQEGATESVAKSSSGSEAIGPF
jgi:hypothetical protein